MRVSSAAPYESSKSKCFAPSRVIYVSNVLIRPRASKGNCSVNTDAFLSGYFSALAFPDAHNRTFPSFCDNEPARSKKRQEKWGYSLPYCWTTCTNRLWMGFEGGIHHWSHGCHDQLSMKQKSCWSKEKKHILWLGLQSPEKTIITMETCRNSLLDFNEGFQSKNQCCCCPCTLLAVSCSVTGSTICINQSGTGL